MSIEVQQCPLNSVNSFILNQAQISASTPVPGQVANIQEFQMSTENRI